MSASCGPWHDIFMIHVAILYGGRSGEHEVSRSSAATVLNEISPSHDITLIGIDRDGSWFLQDIPDPVPASLDLKSEESRRILVVPGGGLSGPGGRSMDIDVVLPILHGSYGEDGCIQGLLEIARLPYAGAGVLGSALGMDKDLAKRIWREAGLPVVPWRTLRAGIDDAASPGGVSPELAGELFEELGSPLFIKPANAGSSVGVSRVQNPGELGEALDAAWIHDRKVLVERAVKGREIECAVIGYAVPEAFPPGEIIPAENHQFYDYDAKYLDPDGALLMVPADLPESTAAEIRKTAVAAYRCVEAGGLSRVDFLLEDRSGKIFINEINTLPGMTSISLFPRMAAAGGMDFTALLDRLIDGALAEAAYRNNLSYER